MSLLCVDVAESCVVSSSLMSIAMTSSTFALKARENRVFELGCLAGLAVSAEGRDCFCLNASSEILKKRFVNLQLSEPQPTAENTVAPDRIQTEILTHVEN